MSEIDYGIDESHVVGETGPTTPLKAGAVLVDHIAICSGHYGKKSLDIKQQCTNVTIFEDISKYHLSGRLTVVDGLDVIKNMKLIGQETLTIKMRVPSSDGDFEDIEQNDLACRMPGNSIDQLFRIYSITDYKPLRNGHASYVLHFIDPMAFEFHRKKINKVLRGRYSDMLGVTLYEDAQMKQYMGQNISGLEQTVPENMQLVVPNWNINRLIKFFCENSEVENNKSFKNSMFFYQTLMKFGEFDNQYKFQSFQTMCDPLMKHQMMFLHHGTHERDTSAEHHHTLREHFIIDFERPQKANTLLGKTKGAYASKMTTYDPVRKVHEDVIYSITDVFKRGEKASAHVNQNPMIIDDDFIPICKVDDFLEGEPETKEVFAEQKYNVDFDDKIIHRVNMTNAYSDEEKLVDATESENVQQQIGLEYRDSGELERQALLGLMEQNITRVKVPLRFDVMVGQTVDIKLPPPEINPQEDNEDELEGTTYLVGKLTYEISPQDNYGELTMQCIKESFGTNIASYEPQFIEDQHTEGESKIEQPVEDFGTGYNYGIG